MPIAFIVERDQIPRGKLPDSSLLASSRATTRGSDGSGSDPESLFSSRVKISRVLMLQSAVLMVPLMLFSASPNTLRIDRLVSPAAIVPEKVFLCRYRSSREVREDTDAGISPFRLACQLEAPASWNLFW
eukprot:TRINITY_DN10644_c0_g1_i3.p1 TRINITY_DN10644_c0_g1~~TRINITY_DN10644_c0_g1_i3.p1  ORF type:complete len:130 (-),score=26.07 TRINITY_DN10644_c0_g1_i3:637-1026(-)